MIFRMFLITAGVVLVFTASSYAATDLKGPRGETAYTKVIGIDENYITTSESRFAVTKDTTIHDDDDNAIPYAEIKRSSMVKVLYKRVNGQLISVDIILRKSTSKKMPE
jgi:hypothetical protein